VTWWPRCFEADAFLARGVIAQDMFENEVRAKAVISQRRGGLRDPFAQESIYVWRKRLEQIRDHLTDFYCADDLPHTLFEQIVQNVVAHLTQLDKTREVFIILVCD
jgi:hypothetical protein